MTNYFIAGTILFLSLFAVHVAVAQTSAQPVVNKINSSALTESQKIEQLIATIRSIEGATFLRNGSEHTPQQAASHLEDKWQKHSSKIRTAEDFIQHLATKSSMSGEKYMIRFSDGRQVPTADILHKKLKQLSSLSKN
jgi:hypothetical protein